MSRLRARRLDFGSSCFAPKIYREPQAPRQICNAWRNSSMKDARRSEQSLISFVVRMTLLNRLFSGPSLKKEISNDHQEASAKAKRDQVASPEPRNSPVLRGSFAALRRMAESASAEAVARVGQRRRSRSPIDICGGGACERLSRASIGRGQRSANERPDRGCNGGAFCIERQSSHAASIEGLGGGCSSCCGVTFRRGGIPAPPAHSQSGSRSPRRRLRCRIGALHPL